MSSRQAQFLRHNELTPDGRWVARKNPIPSPPSRSLFGRKKTKPSELLFQARNPVSGLSVFELANRRSSPPRRRSSPPRRRSSSPKRRSSPKPFFGRKKKSPQLTSQQLFMQRNPTHGMSLFQKANLKNKTSLQFSFKRR